MNSKSLKALFAGILFLAVACAGQAAAQAWTQLAPTGKAPAGRYEHSAVFNTYTDRMIVFGGYSSTTLNDVWVLASADGVGGTPAWTHLAPAGTPTQTRYVHSAVYDAAKNRMIVFAGIANNSCSNDVWVLSNADGTGGSPAWTQLKPLGTSPGVRYFHSATYDPTSGRMTIFGGYDCSSRDLNDVWVLSNANGLNGSPTWTQLNPAGTPPSARAFHSAVYAPATNRMVVFGGCTTASCPSNDVWALSNANGLGTPAWTQLSPTGTPPPARFFHTAVYDPATNNMVVFGGYATTGLANDTWVLSHADGTGGTPTWTQLRTAGTLPGQRDLHTTVYNAATNRMVVFGGCTAACPTNDIWVLSNASGAVDMHVGIDIDVGMAPNTITLARDHDIVVAVLSTSTLNAPIDVDRKSLTLGRTGTEASLTACNTDLRDANGDGRMDLICHFSVPQTGFHVGDAAGYLKGMTTVGNSIHGTDAVIVK